VRLQPLGHLPIPSNMRWLKAHVSYIQYQQNFWPCWRTVHNDGTRLIAFENNNQVAPYAVPACKRQGLKLMKITFA
jgi:hypothetical protein